MGQCSVIVCSKYVSVGKIIEVLSDFGKNYGQKYLTLYGQVVTKGCMYLSKPEPFSCRFV